MAKSIIICINCKKKKTLHAHKLCSSCYMKFYRKTYKPILTICPRCKRKRPCSHKGYCTPCYNHLYQFQNSRKYRAKKFHNINVKTYDEITKECFVCGFKEIVELHHMDKNHKNTSKENLIGLCPNHHKMIHTFKYRKEIMKIIVNKFNSSATLVRDELS